MKSPGTSPAKVGLLRQFPAGHGVLQADKSTAGGELPAVVRNTSQDPSGQDERLATMVAEAVEERICAVFAGFAALPADAQAAVRARLSARARGFFTVREFAAVIGRHAQYVSDRCAANVIRTLRGGKPYRIPLSEEEEWNKLCE